MKSTKLQGAIRCDLRDDGLIALYDQLTGDEVWLTPEAVEQLLNFVDECNRERREA